MNNYGVIVNEIGMEHMIDALQADVLAAVAEALFPAQGGGALDGHHSFIVQYKQGEDLGLDMHTDDSDVTFNVCLGKDGFTGAGLSFCGVLGGPAHRKLSLVYKHVRGKCVVHLGTHRHGADDIQSGERLNLIVWNHSTLYRSTNAYKWRDVPEETESPSLECVSYTHDRDYGKYKTYPPGKERFCENGVVSSQGRAGEDEVMRARACGVGVGGGKFALFSSFPLIPPKLAPETLVVYYHHEYHTVSETS